MPVIDDAELPIGDPSDSWRQKAREGAMQSLAERNAVLASQNAKMRAAIKKYLSHQLSHLESYTVLRDALN